MPDPKSSPRPTKRASHSLSARCDAYTSAARTGPARLLPSEHVGSFIITLPRSSARQRGMLLTYAVEDRVATPIDTVTVVQGPQPESGSGGTLALVCNTGLLADAGVDGRRLLPEFLLVPRPVPSGTDTAWAVWREGARAVVRVSDGTGFAAPVDLLPMLWSRAGSPALTSLAMSLPPELPATDVSSDPPPPDPADLAFSFGGDRREQGLARRAAGRALAGVAFAGVLCLAFLAADTLALSRLSDQTRGRAQDAVAAPLPGVTVTRDVAPIIARMAPRATRLRRGAFLPLLNEVTTALADAEGNVTFRRLAWGAQDGALVVLAQTSGLDELQRLQQELEARGFAVRSGAASAGDGGAESELRISRGGS